MQQAKRNVQIASIEDKIDFILGDALKIINTIDKIDSAFLDPDWAKTGDDKENHVPALSQMVPPTDSLLNEVFKKTGNVCLRLPKEFDTDLINGLPEHETESVLLDGKLKFYCVYFGDLIYNAEKSELKIYS